MEGNATQAEDETGSDMMAGKSSTPSVVSQTKTQVTMNTAITVVKIAKDMASRGIGFALFNRA